MKYENTYWNTEGKYQRMADELKHLIPLSDSVDKPRSTNKKLEKFRKACNCYYDLYNNGLCNRRGEFRTVFGIASTRFVYSRYQDKHHDEMYEITEKKMDQIVWDAYAEQKKLGNVVETNKGA